jgi:hypothetical protein
VRLWLLYHRELRKKRESVNGIFQGQARRRGCGTKIGIVAANNLCMIFKDARPLTSRLCVAKENSLSRKLWPSTLSKALCHSDVFSVYDQITPCAEHGSSDELPVQLKHC